jgi:hypothetical protein
MSTETRISKVKQKDGWIIIQSTEKNGYTQEREVTFKCSDTPHEDLINAFDALVEHARTILEWPSSYADGRIRISGVSSSFSEDTGVEGAVLTGQVALDGSDAPFCFNTPHLAFEQYSEGGVSKLMPEEAQDALKRLRDEAAAFMLNGKRAQGDLFEQARVRVLVPA